MERKQPYAVNNLFLVCERFVSKFVSTAADTENYVAAGEGRAGDIDLTGMVKASLQLDKVLAKFDEKKENGQPLGCFFLM